MITNIESHALFTKHQKRGDKFKQGTLKIEGITTHKFGRFFTYEITNIMEITLYLSLTLTLTLDIKSP